MMCPELTSSPTTAASAATTTSLAVNDDCLELVFEFLDFGELITMRQVQRRWDARTCATVTCLNGRVHDRIDTRPGGCSNGVQNRFPTANHDALVRGLQACLPGPLTSIRFAAPRNHLSSDEGQRIDWAAFMSGRTRDDSAGVSTDLVAGLPLPPRGSAKESALTDIDVGSIRGGLGANMIAAGHPRLRRLGQVILDDSSDTGSLHFLGRMRPLTHVDLKTEFSCPTAVADQFVSVLARHATHLRLHLGGGDCDTVARCAVLESLDLKDVRVNLWAKLSCGPTLRRLRVVDSSGMLGDIVDFVKRRCPVLESLVLDEPTDRELEDLSRELDMPSDPAADSCAGLLRSPGSLPASLTELAVDTRLLLPSAQQVHAFRQSESSEARRIADFGSTIDGVAFPPALQRLGLASTIVTSPATDRVSISFPLESSIRALDVIVLGQAAIRGGVFEAACSRLRLLSELRIDFDAMVVGGLAPLLEIRDVLTVLEIRGGTCADAAALWADRVRAHVDAFPKASRFAGGADPRQAARALDIDGTSPDGRSRAQPGFTDVLSALRFLKVLQLVGCGLFHSVGFLDGGMVSRLEQLEFRRNGATGPRVSPAGDVLRAVFGASWSGPLQLRVLDVSGCVGRSHLANIISAPAAAADNEHALSSAPTPSRVVFPPSRFPYLHTIAGIGAAEGYVRTNPGEAHPLTRRSYYRPSA